MSLAFGEVVLYLPAALLYVTPTVDSPRPTAAVLTLNEPDIQFSTDAFDTSLTPSNMTFARTDGVMILHRAFGVAAAACITQRRLNNVSLR